MRQKLAIAVAVLLVLAVAAPAATIPAGTHVSVRLNRELKSGTDTVGSTFDGVLAVYPQGGGGRTLVPTKALACHPPPRCGPALQKLESQKLEGSRRIAGAA